MKINSSIPGCSLSLLKQWRRNISLNNRESSLLAGELLTLDRQISRFIERRLRIVVFGRVGVGKSSLLNALIGRKVFHTDIKNGSTRHSQAIKWEQQIKGLNNVELIDTPGIDEINAASRERLATRIALQADLVLMVLDSDITSIETEALHALLKSGKPVQLVLNRCDQWTPKQKNELLESIASRLTSNAERIVIHSVASSPRKAQVMPNGRIRSYLCKPQVEPLRNSIIQLLSKQGELLLAVNALKQADNFSQSLKQERLRLRKKEAQGIIGRFAVMKASGVAANPLVILDLAGGIACDTALIIRLCKLYEMEMGGPAARQLLKRLSGYNALLGGAQIGIQIILGTIRQALLFAAPITSGLSLAPATPVALAQAALAIHTTKVTGRLAAKELLLSSRKKILQPSFLLQRLARNNPEAKLLLNEWSKSRDLKKRSIQALLP